MTKSQKSKSMKLLWKGDDDRKADCRCGRWERIDWEEGVWDPAAEYPGELQKDFANRVAQDVEGSAACWFVFGESCEASGWVEWDYALASFLYVWYHLPEESLIPFFVDECAQVICMPEAFSARNVARLFDSPHARVLGMDGLAKKLEDLNRIIALSSDLSRSKVSASQEAEKFMES